MSMHRNPYSTHRPIGRTVGRITAKWVNGWVNTCIPDSGRVINVQVRCIILINMIGDKIIYGMPIPNA